MLRLQMGIREVQGQRFERLGAALADLLYQRGQVHVGITLHEGDVAEPPLLGALRGEGDRLRPQLQAQHVQVRPGLCDAQGEATGVAADIDQEAAASGLGEGGLQEVVREVPGLSQGPLQWVGRVAAVPARPSAQSRAKVTGRVAAGLARDESDYVLYFWPAGLHQLHAIQCIAGFPVVELFIAFSDLCCQNFKDSAHTCPVGPHALQAIQ
mmetsp:Transcript_10771/g.30379  ORF Transcript_10771/g.30379 Transcript_10771/m.30379 type:complete len:211 (-) Transcript_10771:324-956(-)